MGDYARAEPLLKQSYEMRKTALRENHPSLANSLNSLAGLYFHSGDIDRALQFSEQSHEIVKKSLGENHPTFAASLHNLASLHLSIGDYTNADPHSRRGLGITRQHLDQTAVFLSERQQLAMSEGLRFRLDIYLSLTLAYPPASRNAFFETFAWKGATLVRQRGIRLAASDPQVAGQFQQLRIIASQISTLSNSVPDKEESRPAWREQLKRLTEERKRWKPKSAD